MKRILKQQIQMKSIKIFLLFLFPIISNAQNIFEGVILNKVTKVSIPYASIFLLKGKTGVNADEKGFFKLEITNRQVDDSLIVTCMGYAPLKFPVQDADKLGSASAKIELTEVVHNLKEVVIPNNNFKNSIKLNQFDELPGQYYGSGNFIAQLAQHFVSPSKNAMLKDIKIAKFSIPILSPQKAIFRIRVYAVDSVSKAPSYDLTDEVIEVKSSSKIVELNLEKYKIYLPNNEFFIAIEWLRIPYNATETKINGKTVMHYAPSIGWFKNQASKMDIWQLGLNNLWDKFPAYLNSNLAIAVSLKY
jgi:hypothetical protein